MDVSVLRRFGNRGLLFEQIVTFSISFGGIVSGVAAIFQILQMVSQPITVLQFRIGGPLQIGLILIVSAIVAAAWISRRKLVTNTLQDDDISRSGDSNAERNPGNRLSADVDSVPPIQPIQQSVYLRDIVFRPSLTSVNRFAWTEAGWIALFFLFSFYMFSLSFSEYRKEQALLNAFEVTSGTILLKEASENQGLGTLIAPHITYSFQVNGVSSTDEISYTNRVSVPEIVFSSISELDGIPIRFASKNPEWSEIEGQHVSSTPSALFFLGIAIVALGYAAKRARQLWLEFIFQQGTEDSRRYVDGVLVTGWESNSMYHIAFRYTVKDEEYRVGQVVAHSDFIALRIGNSLKIRYLMQRPSICKAVEYLPSEGAWVRLQIL